MSDVVARSVSSRGETVLLRRTTDDALELRVNGVFVMDTAETATERALARTALHELANPRGVLIGGLGLGYTTQEVLRDPRVQRVTVVEIEAAVAAWLRDGTVAHGPALFADPRLEVVVADLRDFLAAAPPRGYDAILLDVDNGPGHLVYDANATVYEERTLSLARRALRPGGRLAVWSASSSPLLAQRLRGAFGNVAVVTQEVELQGRDERYWTYLSRRTDPLGSSASAAQYVRAVSDFRIEHDSMGDVEVPIHAKWRAQTQRAVENFPISGRRLESANIEALALIKAAAARVNAQLGVLEPETAKAIAEAADGISSGEHLDEFPIDVFQTGSGTSSNMNMNEVIATLAAEGGVQVHPNDHVNASQSSNDTFPTSIHVAAALAVDHELIPALNRLGDALAEKAGEFGGVVKSGRTHLMDATPVMLGQEFGGYAAACRYAVERLNATLPRVLELPLGGTAVGTGINTPPGFAAKVIAELASVTGLPFTEARDHFEAQGARDALVELSGQLRTIAVSLTKICNDLRWMGSGPRTGLGEINLPDLQPGSSIMPGKVNPVLPEATLMVCAQVIGNDVAVTVSGSAGSFELNVMMPVLARNLLESIRLLATSTRLLADRCVDGITANQQRLREYAESSPSIVTPLNRYLGYENAAKVAKRSLAEHKTIRQVVEEMGYVEDGTITVEQLDAALDVDGMTHP